MTPRDPSSEPGAEPGADPRTDPDTRTAHSPAPGVLVVDLDGVVRHANRSAVSLMGAEGPLRGTFFGFPLGRELDERIDVRSADGERRSANMKVARCRRAGEEVFVVALSGVAHPDPEQPGHTDPEPAAGGRSTEQELDDVALSMRWLRDAWDDVPPTLRVAHLRTVEHRVRQAADSLTGLLDAVRFATSRLRPGPGRCLPLDVVLSRLPELGRTPATIDVDVEEDISVAVSARHLWAILGRGLLAAMGGPGHVRIASSGEYGWAVVCISAATSDPAWTQAALDGPGGPHDGSELWICRTLARACGGDAWFEARDDRGGTMCIRLPDGVRAPDPRGEG